MTDKIPQRCDHCWYGLPWEHDATKVQCRRHAPIVTGGLHCAISTEWPIVETGDYCGDWSYTGSSGNGTTGGGDA